MYKRQVDTLLEVCRLRSESIRGQLEGDYPITRAQQEMCIRDSSIADAFPSVRRYFSKETVKSM